MGNKSNEKFGDESYSAKQSSALKWGSRSLILVGGVLVLSFQNCSQTGFNLAGSSTSSSSTKSTASSWGSDGAVSPGSSASAASSSFGDTSVSNPANLGSGAAGANVYFYDASIGNASYLLQFSQKIVGVGGAGLRGCTNPIANYNSACLNDSDFRDVASQVGWSYNSSSDTYSLSLDVSSYNYPQGSYFSRFILPNGKKVDVKFKPVVHLDSSKGNGSILTNLKETVSGFASGFVKACTNPLANYNSACLKDSEFVLITSAAGWSYNSSSDQYSIDSNVQSLGYPQVPYFSRFILPNGMRTEVKFTPSVSVTAAPQVTRTCAWGPATAVAGPCSSLPTCTESLAASAAAVQVISCASPTQLQLTCSCK